jgi:hypothetical protein
MLSTAVQSLGIVALVLVLCAVGSVIRRLAAVETAAVDPMWLDEGLFEFLLGLAAVSLLGMILAILGLFSLVWLVFVGGLAIALGLLRAWQKRRLPSPREFRRNWVAFVLMAIVAAATFNVLRPFDATLYGIDASVYLAIARDIAYTGGIGGIDGLAAEMLPEERAALFENRFANDATGRYARFPGGVQLTDLANSRVSFHFYHLWPVLLAVGLVTLGSPGFLGVLSIFTALSLICLFRIGQLLAGTGFGAAVAALALFWFPEVYYGRFPLSEVPAQAYFLAGLFCFIRALQTEGSPRLQLQVLAALLWGCMCLCRVDSLFFLVPSLMAVFFLVPELRRSWREWLPLAVGLLLVAALAIAHQVAAMTYSIAFKGVPLVGGLLPAAAEWLADKESALVAIWLVVAAGSLAAIARPFPRWIRLSTWWLVAATAVAIVIVWLITFTRRATGTRTVDHLGWLSLYLPGPVMTGMVLGLAMLGVALIMQPSKRSVAGILLAFMAIPLASVLMNPMVSAAQPWAIRRFVPMALPLLLMLALAGWHHAFSAWQRLGAFGRHAYLMPAAIALVFFVGQSGFLWRQPLFQDVGSQVRRAAESIPADSLVILPDTMAGTHLPVALNYGEKRSTLLLPMGEAADSPVAGAALAYVKRRLSAGKKVVAWLPEASPSLYPLLFNFELRPLYSGDISFFDLPQQPVGQFPGTIVLNAMAYHVFQVLPRRVIPRAEMLSTLAAGVDFSQAILPQVIAETRGISPGEPDGRWTDGPLSHVRFVQPLPERFSLELDIVRAYERDRSVPLKVVVGSERKDLYIPEGGAGIVRLDFAPRTPADTVEIHISNPTSPKSRGRSPDGRLLGIQLKGLRVLPPGYTRQMLPDIDFAKARLPSNLVALSGIAGREADGRWTDGPLARLKFASPLPERFSLEIDIARVYERNSAPPLKVVVGSERKDLHIPEGGAGIVRLAFAPRSPVDTVEIHIPNPTSPKSRGQSPDMRLLGIQLKRLRVLVDTE